MTKSERERLELEFSRKQYNVIPTEEMARKVNELEKLMDNDLEIWDDEFVYESMQRLKRLNVSDRRLLLVYSILDSSIIKTASYFRVSRKTVLTNINRIKSIILD